MEDQKELIVGTLNADTINVKHLNVEEQKLEEEDIPVAKKSGSFFGDPVFVVRR